MDVTMHRDENAFKHRSRYRCWTKNEQASCNGRTAGLFYTAQPKSLGCSFAYIFAAA
jgi:hypothetical protein